MQICEIFSSIEGEGIRAGYPCTFIRTVGCNLRCSYCFASDTNGNYPKVLLNTLTYKPINELRQGDVLLTLDKDNNSVATTVKEVITHNVNNNILQLTINNRQYYVTQEHPFFTNNGIKAAKDLNIGDCIIGICNSYVQDKSVYTSSKPIKVYNLACEPYNTYLVDGMLVHNCDSTYSFMADANTKNMTVPEIIDVCKQLGNYRVTFTGGEPLLQKEALSLIKELINNGFQVNIETNGAVSIEEISAYRKQSFKAHNNLFFTIDYKCPSSNEENKMLSTNWHKLNYTNDVIKFVVGSKEDLDSMRKWVTTYPHVCKNIFVSPVFGEIESKQIVEYIKENNLQNVRLQLQIHKYVWPINERGV